MWQPKTPTKFSFSLKLTKRTKHLQRTAHLILNRSLKLHRIHLVIPVSLLSVEQEQKWLAQTEISVLYMSKVRWDVSQPVSLFRARLSSGLAVLSPENWSSVFFFLWVGKLIPLPEYESVERKKEGIFQ